LTQLKHFIMSRWDELLITCVYLNASVASIFTGDIRKVLLVWLGGLALLAVILLSEVRFRRGIFLCMGRMPLFRCHEEVSSSLWDCSPRP